MARAFATTDRVTVANGNVGAFKYGTIAAVVNITTQTDYAEVLYGRAATANTFMEIGFNPTGGFMYGLDAAEDETAGGPATTDGPCVCVWTKATGNVFPVYYKYVIATGVLTTVTATGFTVPDGTRTLATLYIGNENTAGFPLNGQVEAVAVWNNQVLSADQVATLCTSYAAWLALSPAPMWMLDQAATTQSIPDVAGDADQTALTGTTIGAASMGMGYGHPILAPTAVTVAAFDPTTTQPRWDYSHSALRR